MALHTGCGETAAAADDGFDTCMAESGGVTVAMLDCIGTSSDRAQSVMDTILAEHRPQMAPEKVRALDAAQRDWPADLNVQPLNQTRKL